MSAKWMRVETDFVDHPKTSHLRRLLGNDCAEAYVLRAWSFVSRFCPTGHVRDIDGTALEDACRWRGESGELLNALVAAGWFEARDTGGWDAHDWADHQGKVAARAEKERERKRAYREKKALSASAPVPRTSHGREVWDNSSRPAQRDVTGRDVTGRDVVVEEAPPPAIVEKVPVAFVEPTTPPDTWLGEDFFAWAQSLRQKAGFVGERRRPRDLGAWWSTCLMTPGVTVERMQQAFLAFGDSKHWQTRTPALPFAGFMSQWDQFLPREVRHAS